MLQQNHWKSPASPPSRRPPQSNFPIEHWDDLSQEQIRAGSSRRKHSTSASMDGGESTYGRRRRSQSTTEKGELKSYREAIGSGSSDADEENKPLTAGQHDYSASTSFARPTSHKHESDAPSSEEEETDDEEAGLTKADRGRRRRRRRRHTSLDERVAGSQKVSNKKRKLADLSVLKSSAINALLIGLWYVTPEAVKELWADRVTRYLFSLSISIVGTPELCPFDRVRYLTRPPVQQMDVFTRTPQLPLPSIHNLHAHACPVQPRIPRPLPHPTLPTPRRQPIQSSQPSPNNRRAGGFRPQKASHDSEILPQPHRPLRSSNRT